MTESSARPRVSIVLPTYNQDRFLPDALDGIFNQTWSDFELIVVNDGSTDDTPTILDDYRSRHDFIIIDQENGKLPNALNTGFRRARGAYLTWTSSDNVMLPDMLEVLVEALDANPDIGLVYADWEILDEDGARIGEVNTFEFDRHLLLRENYINACFLYRRFCQERVGLYDPEFIYVEDWEYWFRISEQFDMMRIPQVLYQYRNHSQSLTESVVNAPASERYAPTYQLLQERFRSNLWAWYFSKMKLEWQRIRRKGPGYVHECSEITG